jgi:hypothetical protein
VRAFVIHTDQVFLDLVAAIRTIDSTALSDDTGGIVTSGLDLTDLLFEDAPMSRVADQLASYGDAQLRRWVVGVDQRRAPFFKPEGTNAQAWAVDASDLTIQRSLAPLITGAYAVYRDPNGTTQRTATTDDARAAARAGVTRQRAVNAPYTDSTLAQTTRDLTLAANKQPAVRADVRFTAVYDAAGQRVPLWCVHPGDTLTIRNLPISTNPDMEAIRTMRIGETEYDAVTDTLRVTPRDPLPAIDVLLGRRQVTPSAGA